MALEAIKTPLVGKSRPAGSVIPARPPKGRRLRRLSDRFLCRSRRSGLDVAERSQGFDAGVHHIPRLDDERRLSAHAQRPLTPDAP